MKYKHSFSCLFVVIVSVLFACHGPEKKQTKNASAAGIVRRGESYLVDTQQSLLTWEGSMVLSSSEQHVGFVHFSKGELMIEDGELVGGMIEIDLKTMEYKDKTNKNTPIFHLKSADYFDVAKFPTSTIIITKASRLDAQTIEVTGDLTIRGVTHPVTFPAEFQIKDGTVKASGKLVIDRTDWGIRYRSGRFYDNLADQAVSDEIEFLVEIVAKDA